MTHKTYRKEVKITRLGTLVWREDVLHPVRRDSDDHLTWDHFNGTDAGFVCWCGLTISTFADAVALASVL